LLKADDERSTTDEENEEHIDDAHDSYPIEKVRVICTCIYIYIYICIYIYYINMYIYIYINQDLKPHRTLRPREYKLGKERLVHEFGSKISFRDSSHKWYRHGAVKVEYIQIRFICIFFLYMYVYICK
jgi:hypothetical protein